MYVHTVDKLLIFCSQPFDTWHRSRHHHDFSLSPWTCAQKMSQLRSSAMFTSSLRHVLSTSSSRISVSSIRTLSVAAPLADKVGSVPVSVYNPDGAKRVIVTKPLPGDRWLESLIDADARVEVCALEGPDYTILDVDTIKELIGNHCNGAIGQLTENWGGQEDKHTICPT